MHLSFLVRAFRIKEPDYYSHFFSLRKSRMRRNFCSVCSTKRIPGNRIQVIAKGPFFHFLLFKRNLQNRTRPKGPPFHFFRR